MSVWRLADQQRNTATLEDGWVVIRHWHGHELARMTPEAWEYFRQESEKDRVKRRMKQKQPRGLR